MIFSAAVRAAAACARRTNRPMFVCKDGLATDGEWEVCTEFDADTHYAGSSCIHEVDADGLIGETS